MLKIDILDRLFCQKMPSDISSVIILAGLVGDPITNHYPEPSEKINYVDINKIITIYTNKTIRFIFVTTYYTNGFLEHIYTNHKNSLIHNSL